MNPRLSEHQRQLLLLAHSSSRPVLQSTALAEVFGLKPRTRLRPRPGRYYAAQRIDNYNASRTSLTRSLRRLERDGLVLRKPGKAGRAAFELTESGTATATELAQEEQNDASNQVQTRSDFQRA
jgi:hypothetical protein